jgi:hypothetical protein
MAAKKPTNPLYIAALPVGILFAITSCAFVVMMLQGGDPQVGERTGLMRLLDRHGVLILVVELAVLGILTVGAIFTDEFWTRRFEAAAANEQRREPSA